MSEENTEHQEKKEYITEEINTDMANIQNGEQIQDEENGEEGEEYNMEEGGDEEGEYNIEDGGEEGEYNIEDGEEEGQEFQAMNQEGDYNPEDGPQEGEEEGEEEVGEEQIVEDGEQNNDQQIQNENEEIENEENNQLNQEQEENEDDDQNELVDYQNNIENADNNEHIEENNLAEKEEANKQENKLEIKSNKEESETKIEENKGINLINSKKVLKPSKQKEQKEEGKEEGKEEPKKEDIEKIKVEQPQIELIENKKETKDIPSENLNIIKPKNEIKPLEKKDEKNKEENKNIIQKEKKETKAPLQKPEKQGKKEEEIKWARHVFHSNETNPNEGNQNDKRSNYQFHCTVVTKKKQPSAAPIPKQFSQPVSKPINTKYTQNQQTQNKNTRVNVINTTNVKPKTPTQPFENKRKANPITIQTKYDNKKNEPKKYEPKKYEPPKQAKPANTSYIINIAHNKPQIQKPIQSQPQKSYKKTEIKIATQTQNKYQQKKPEYSRITIDRSKISSSNQNIRSNNQQIFNSRTSKETPKLKYYVRCPNCGYHLNDESAVNNYNRTNGAYNSGFINKRENYENKAHLRTAIKDKDKSIASQGTNTNNYRRNIDYSQKTNVKYSVKNLQKDKDFTPSNITYYESYGTSRKSRHGTNP